MKFGQIASKDAAGAILAHSIEVGGKRWRKGRILGAGDVEALLADGPPSITAAQLAATDLGEDAAASQIAAALVPDQSAACVRLTKASTGRVNVYGTGSGVLDLNPVAIDGANRVDPMITIATLPEWALVRDRGLLATVKIISYGVPGGAVAEAARLASEALRVRPVVLRTAALIITDIGLGPGKGEAAMRGRLAALGMDLMATHLVPHKSGALAEAIGKIQADLVLILTASATSDPMDVAPEAVRLAGGQVSRFGMPVDPGNLLFLGDVKGRPVIGLPGCARSPALNGADWVLSRVACGIETTGSDIAGMGVGGLLKEIPTRPQPRAKRKE